jgi:hypothetical protein
MALLRALLYLAAAVLVIVGACGVRSRVSLATLGAGLALLAYALPAITGAL